jgi:hypothetical protein
VGNLLGGGVWEGLRFVLGSEACGDEGKGDKKCGGSGVGADHGLGQRAYFPSLKRVAQAPVKTRLRLGESSFADFAYFLEQLIAC